MNPFAIFDFWASLNGDDVTKPHAKVVTNDAVKSNLVVADCVVRQNYAHSLAAFFA